MSRIADHTRLDVYSSFNVVYSGSEERYISLNTWPVSLVSVALVLLLFGCGERNGNWSRLPDSQPSQTQQSSQTAHLAEALRERHPTTSPAVLTSGALAAAGLQFSIPPDWTPQQPSSPIRLAQFALPGNCELVITHFGAGQGGPARANIERWISQFSPDDDTSGTAAAQTTETVANGLRSSIVYVSGTYSPSMSMGSMPAAAPKPDWAMFGAIIEGGAEGSVFIKATGPRRALQPLRPSLESFIHGIKPQSGESAAVRSFHPYHSPAGITAACANSHPEGSIGVLA